MTSQGRHLMTPDETVYICTGESYEEKYSTDITEGLRKFKVLHRVEGDAWVLEKTTLVDGDAVFTECERITDEQAKQILIELGKIDALVKHGFVKLHGADTKTAEEEAQEDEGTAGDEQMPRIPAEWVRELGQVRDELLKLAEGTGNDPEQRSALEDCIKEISTIEKKLLESDKVNPEWQSVIPNALGRTGGFLSRAGERAAADEIGELLKGWFQAIKTVVLPES